MNEHVDVITVRSSADADYWTIASYILKKPGRLPQEAAAEVEKLERQTRDERRTT